MLREHVGRILAQDYDDVELYARLCALLALWNIKETPENGVAEEAICPK